MGGIGAAVLGYIADLTAFVCVPGVRVATGDRAADGAASNLEAANRLRTSISSNGLVCVGNQPAPHLCALHICALDMETWTSESAAGVTPGRRLAWPMVMGRTRSRVSRISRERPLMALYSIQSGMVRDSAAFNFSIDFFC